jgi:succinate dehydrogenase/fumarate reductase flavoprotein subunit
MNPQALELYRRNGIDLTEEPLKIAVCAQHSNGGLDANIWWESNIKHLFPVGEVNGSHGVSRPGGSALNAGQVGGLRAAQYISNRYDEFEVDYSRFLREARPRVDRVMEKAKRWLEDDSPSTDKLSPKEARRDLQERMSKAYGPIRKVEEVKTEAKEAEKFFRSIDQILVADKRSDLPAAFQTRHLALTHLFYALAIKNYVENGGGSRGSYMIVDEEGDSVIKALPEDLRYRSEDEGLRARIQEQLKEPEGEVSTRWVDRRDLPEEKFWFETVWKEFREGEVFD